MDFWNKLVSFAFTPMEFVIIVIILMAIFFAFRHFYKKRKMKEEFLETMINENKNNIHTFESSANRLSDALGKAGESVKTFGEVVDKIKKDEFDEKQKLRDKIGDKHIVDKNKSKNIINKR